MTDAGNPAAGDYDMQYQLFDTATVGTGVQMGATVVRSPVTATAGVFNVALDFGANVFDGTARYLQTGVRPAGSVASYVVLEPRQPVLSTPYAIRTLKAGLAEVAIDANQLGGVAASQYVTTDDPRLLVPAAGSSSYIQNSVAVQAGASFNISGDGLVGGKVGVGTATPLATLHVAGATGAFGGMFIEATEGDRAALYYAKDQALAFDSYRPSDGRRLPILLQANGGRVSVGPGLPSHALGVFGGPAWTSNGWTGGVELSNSSAIGWQKNAGGQRFGIGQSGGGLFFFHTASDPGTSGSPANYDLLIADSGKVSINTIGPVPARLYVEGAPSDLATIEGTSAVGGISVYGRTNGGTAIYGFATNGGIPGAGQAGYFYGDVGISGYLALDGLTNIGGGSGSQLCLLSAGDTRVAKCGSSLRYKKDVQLFVGGMDLVNRLQPRTFRWKADDSEDVGFIAEEVAEVEPLLVTRNAGGQIEGVKYDRMSAILVNALREQQDEIAQQRQQLDLLRRENRKAENDALRVELEALKSQLAALLARQSK